MSALTNPTANHASEYVAKHLNVGGKIVCKNIFTENEWKAYTPVVVTGGTFATSFTRLYGRWRLQGTTMHVRFTYADSAGTGAATSGEYRISLPPGIVYNLGYNTDCVGAAQATEAATPINFTGTVNILGTTSPTFGVLLGNEATTPTPWGNGAPAPLRLTTATGKVISASFSFEIEASSPLLLMQNN